MVESFSIDNFTVQETENRDFYQVTTRTFSCQVTKLITVLIPVTTVLSGPHAVTTVTVLIPGNFDCLHTSNYNSITVPMTGYDYNSS